MNEFANWGRWVAVSFFTVLGSDSLIGACLRIPSVIREHPNEVTYYFISDVLFWVPALFCVWGLLVWRRWALTVGLTLSLAWAVATGIAVVVVGRPADDSMLILIAATACLVSIWLRLPAVREKYSRRNQIA